MAENDKDLECAFRLGIFISGIVHGLDKPMDADNLGQISHAMSQIEEGDFTTYGSAEEIVGVDAPDSLREAISECLPAMRERETRIARELRRIIAPPSD